MGTILFYKLHKFWNFLKAQFLVPGLVQVPQCSSLIFQEECLFLVYTSDIMQTNRVKAVDMTFLIMTLTVRHDNCMSLKHWL